MVRVPPDESLGPAMRMCTASEQAFVIAMINTGGASKKHCAVLAGYAGDGKDAAARVAGSRVAARPRVIAAMKEEAEKRMCAGVGLAANVILEIALDPMHKDRLKAAEILKNQAGLMVATRVDHSVVVRDERTSAEIQQQTIELAQRLGVKLPQIESHAIDAEYEEVSYEGLEGLEDIL